MKLGGLHKGCLGETQEWTLFTLSPVPTYNVPRDRIKDITYSLITVLIRPEKIDKPKRTQLVAGGNRVHYPGDAGTPTADLLTVKLLISSIISIPNAKFMIMDIKTPMTCFKYMWLKILDMPEDVIKQYNL